MPIVFFLILAGVWAVFLLPQLFEGRRNGPSSSLRNLQRSVALANIVTPGRLEALSRRRTMNRRRRTLVTLGVTAAGSLAAAIYFNSVTWLAGAFAVDFALAGYVTMLLSIREQKYRAAQKVVKLPSQPTVASGPMRVEEPTASVRVVAG